MRGREVFIVDAVRTPIGRHGGSLAHVRPDDLAATVVRALVDRHPALDPARIGDVVFGDANGAGEDNRDVARMAVLLAGLPTSEGRLFSEEQIEARGMTIRAAYRVARTVAKECLGGS